MRGAALRSEVQPAAGPGVSGLRGAKPRRGQREIGPTDQKEGAKPLSWLIA
jgi:hypothetical protein